jgi:hypothetical protein
MGPDFRRLFRASGLSGTPLDFSSNGRCCSKLGARGGGAALDTTCRGTTSRAGALEGARPPRTASLVGTTAAVVITLERPIADAGTTTEFRPTGFPEANVLLETPVTAPFTEAFS